MTYDNPTSLHSTFRISCTSGQTLGSRTTETHSASSCTDFIAGKQTVNVVSYQDHPSPHSAGAALENFPRLSSSIFKPITAATSSCHRAFPMHLQYKSHCQ
jgi:hypothetical protein